MNVSAEILLITISNSNITNNKLYFLPFQERYVKNNHVELSMILIFFIEGMGLDVIM